MASENYNAHTQKYMGTFDVWPQHVTALSSAPLGMAGIILQVIKFSSSTKEHRVVVKSKSTSAEVKTCSKITTKCLSG